MAQLSQFININTGSVTDPSILWDAVKGFIRNNATLYASRLSELELKLSTLDINLLQQHLDDQVALQHDLVQKDSNAILKWGWNHLVRKQGAQTHTSTTPPEFYTTFWHGLDPLLLDMIQASLEKGSFSRDVNTAIMESLQGALEATDWDALYQPHTEDIDGITQCIYMTLKKTCVTVLVWLWSDFKMHVYTLVWLKLDRIGFLSWIKTRRLFDW